MATKEKDDWLLRVLGVQQPTSSAPPTPDPTRKKELTARLLSVRDDAKVQGVLADLAGALREAGTAVQGGGPDAEQQVDALETRLAELVRAQRVQQARQTIAESAPPVAAWSTSSRHACGWMRRERPSTRRSRT